MTDNITDATVIENNEEASKNMITFSKWEVKMLFHPSLSEVKITDVDKEFRANLIKLKIALGKVDEELKEYEKSVIDSLKDEKFTELEKEASKEDAREEAKDLFEELKNQVSKEANELLVPKYNETVEIECEKIDEKTFYSIVSSIELTALGGYDYLYKKLVK